MDLHEQPVNPDGHGGRAMLPSGARPIILQESGTPTFG
jgi:hypothetical protein